MFTGTYQIQYASVFTLFLVWFLNSLPYTFFHMKNANRKGHNDAAITNNDLGGANGITGHGSKSLYHKRSKLSNQSLFEGLVLLSLGVVLNHIGQGHKTSGDVFSLITMLALVINAILHWVGITMGGHILWVIAHLSLFGLFLTPWCTDYTGIAF